MITLKILIITVLFLICYQDIRFQAVSWIFFLIGFIIAFIISLKSITRYDLIINSVMIMLFIIFQLAVIYFFSWMKYKKRSNIFNTIFGLGDLLFLIMIVPLFSPLNYLLFFIISMALTLIMFALLKKFNLLKGPTIPLAGLQSLVLILVIISQFFIKFSLYNDYFILQHFIM